MQSDCRLWHEPRYHRYLRYLRWKNSFMMINYVMYLTEGFEEQNTWVCRCFFLGRGGAEGSFPSHSVHLMFFTFYQAQVSDSAAWRAQQTTRRQQLSKWHRAQQNTFCDNPVSTELTVEVPYLTQVSTSYSQSWGQSGSQSHGNSRVIIIITNN